MNGKDTRTSMGKWSIALTLTPLIVVSLLLFLIMIPLWLGRVSGEGGLGVLLAIGMVLYYGSHVVIITSLAGIGLAIVAIHKTFWRRGLPGFLLNSTTLAIATVFLMNLYHKAAIDPDRLPIAAYQGDYKTVEKLLFPTKL